MENRIINSLLKTFSEEQGVDLESQKIEEVFEVFCNYCVLSKEYPDTVSQQHLNNMKTGGGNDGSIDGIAIIVNSDVVDSTQEIDELMTHKNSSYVSFVLVQSKTSPRFQVNSITNFLYGIKDFF